MLFCQHNTAHSDAVMMQATVECQSQDATMPHVRSGTGAKEVAKRPSGPSNPPRLSDCPVPLCSRSSRIVIHLAICAPENTRIKRGYSLQPTALITGIGSARVTPPLAPVEAVLSSIMKFRHAHRREMSMTAVRRPRCISVLRCATATRLQQR